ncbi:bifunctional Prefoldin alpha-like/Prefoldin alpha subunit [Babesia duncani]|uniref:Bifunctional Prefoldin alpha-like/Prefoldin alpha subunit n=1 Tax=Babesia duncani TaxID=323732 RepID=A0AAD9PME5_9APIC|nr:bifunctional Prefoldin alpha-like/Prefoldin alpha subunit [Babesia duncani]
MSTGSEPADAAANKPVNISALSIQELNLLTVKLEEEINQLQSLLRVLTVALERFQESAKALEEFSKSPDQIQVPLTSLVYVPGRIVDPSKVTVAIGAGYYVDMDLERAKDYYARKTRMVEEQIQKLQTIVSGKGRQINQLYTFLDQKLTIAARQGAAQASIS